jgi:MFS family permease
MVGVERTVLPLAAEARFGSAFGAAAVGFVVAFSFAKAIFNLLAGGAADRYGRRAVLLAGWVVMLPVPFMLAFAPAWSWVIAANVLLGIGQALTWSMTVNMMIDVLPAQRRGFAAGINEFFGYGGVSLGAFVTGLIAARLGLEPWPVLLGAAVALAGLLLSLAVPETGGATRPPPLGWVNGTGLPSLLGTLTNMKDGAVWLAIPPLMAARGLSVAEIGLVAGLYPLVWAIGQPLFGPASDRHGRRPYLLSSMLLQAAGLIGLAAATSLLPALIAAVVLGLGTGMGYPVLIAWTVDRVPADRQATALGLYRFFRDGGYGIGALLLAVPFLSGALTLWLLAAMLAAASLTLMRKKAI